MATVVEATAHRCELAQIPMPVAANGEVQQAAGIVSSFFLGADMVVRFLTPAFLREPTEAGALPPPAREAVTAQAVAATMPPDRAHPEVKVRSAVVCILTCSSHQPSLN